MFDKLYELLAKLEGRDLLYAILWVTTVAGLVYVLAGCAAGRTVLEAVKIDHEQYQPPAKTQEKIPNAETNETH